MSDFFVVGDVLVDHILHVTDSSVVESINESEHTVTLPYPAKLQLLNPPHVVWGGNAYTISVALQKLGFSTDLYSVLGNDIYGNEVKESLQSHNVNTEYITVDPNNPTNSGYVLSVGDDRVILTHHYDRQYHIDRIPDCKYVFLSSIGENDLPLYKELLAAKKQQNFQLIFSPGTNQLQEDFADIREIMQATDILFVNKREALALSRLQTDSLENLLKGLHNLGPKTVIITRSTHGAIAYDGTNITKVGSLDVNVIDATGAGDTYAATVAALLAQGQDLQTAMEFGAIHSSEVVCHIGCEEALLDLQSLTKAHADKKGELKYTEPVVKVREELHSAQTEASQGS